MTKATWTITHLTDKNANSIRALDSDKFTPFIENLKKLGFEFIVKLEIKEDD